MSRPAHLAFFISKYWEWWVRLPYFRHKKSVDSKWKTQFETNAFGRM